MMRNNINHFYNFYYQLKALLQSKMALQNFFLQAPPTMIYSSAVHFDLISALIGLIVYRAKMQA